MIASNPVKKRSKHKLLPFKLLALMLYRDAPKSSGGWLTIPLGMYAPSISAPVNKVREYLTHLKELGFIDELVIERKQNKMWAKLRLVCPDTFANIERSGSDSLTAVA